MAHIFSGTYRSELRHCRLRSSDTPAEEETHFVLSCEYYSRLRQNAFDDILHNERFTYMSNENKVCVLLREYSGKAAKFIVKTYVCRRNVIYTCTQ